MYQDRKGWFAAFPVIILLFPVFPAGFKQYLRQPLEFIVFVEFLTLFHSYFGRQ